MSQTDVLVELVRHATAGNEPAIRQAVERLIAEEELNRPTNIGGRIDWIRQLGLTRLPGGNTPLQILLAGCSQWNPAGDAC